MTSTGPQGAGQSLGLLLKVAQYLDEAGYPYVVIGAVAAALHGVVRATLDADALVSLPISTLEKMAVRFSGAGYETELRRGDESDPIPAMLVIRDVSNNRVDLLGGLRGLDPAVFTRAVAVRYFDSTLMLASAEDFLAMKCFAGGPQDLVDARQVMKAVGGSIDVDLLRRLARRFGREAADAVESLFPGEKS